PVVIDPRSDVCDAVRVDVNGSAWFWSSHDNGVYDVAFIFTSKTKQLPTPEAVGVMMDYDGDHQVEWQDRYIGSGGQQFFPTYWTNPNENFQTIEGIAYADAWNAYLAQFGTAQYWIGFAISTGTIIGVGLLADVL